MLMTLQARFPTPVRKEHFSSLFMWKQHKTLPSALWGCASAAVSLLLMKWRKVVTFCNLCIYYFVQLLKQRSQQSILKKKKHLLVVLLLSILQIIFILILFLIGIFNKYHFKEINLQFCWVASGPMNSSRVPGSILRSAHCLPGVLHVPLLSGFPLGSPVSIHFSKGCN